MLKKSITLVLMVMLMLAFASPAMAVCPKAAKTCSSCTGSGCTVSASCGTYTGKNICVTYMQCSGKEYVKITNGKATAQSLKGMKLGLKCAGCKEVKYTLPNTTLKPGKCIWVYTGKGTAKGSTFYLGTSGSILSCKGEVAKIYASCGKLISTKTN